MKKVKILSGTALGIQLTAFLLTILICVFQEPVKQLYTVESEVMEAKVFPAGTLMGEMITICLYLMLFIFAYKAGESAKKIKIAGIILFVMMCVWNLCTGLLPVIEAMVIARKGIYHAAGLSVISQAIGLAAGPLEFIAFGLFAMAVGAGLCAGNLPEKM